MKRARQYAGAVERNGQVALEVLVADTDVVFQDAADVLKSGERSKVLRAIDAGTAVAVMSEQTFNELGWTSGLAARSHSVDQAQLRAVIEKKYLPRIPVVSLPETGSTSWVPDASEVRDHEDVAHVQVARLVGANVVYSHDRDLRSPGFAPRKRPDYEARLEQLTVTTAYRETEEAVVLTTGGAVMITKSVVVKSATVMRVRPIVLTGFLLVGTAYGVYRALSTSERRTRLGDAVQPLVEQVGQAMHRKSAAATHLVSTTYVKGADTDADRLEFRVAALLVREPDKTMGDINDALDLNARERRSLSEMLQSHPSFELSSRWGWSVGGARVRLETWPRRPD